MKALTRRWKSLRATVRHTLWPTRSLTICRSLLQGKIGLEIGGPSSIFTDIGALPLYALVGRLDNCNFSHQTVWEGAIREGRHYAYHPKRPPGYQYVREAVGLHGIPSATYDVVLSSHNLEHNANPLLAVREWLRVLKEDGVLVLVVPHRDGSFDHRRPVTSLAHLVEDDARGVGEDDLTHLPEILALHDLSKDPGKESFEAFKRRSERNVENRCLHHHVFVTETVAALLDRAGLHIRAIERIFPLHIVAVGQKPLLGTAPDNRAWLDANAEADCRLQSPFPSDRS
jgi:SAM-dependent methyltransferase